VNQQGQQWAATWQLREGRGGRRESVAALEVEPQTGKTAETHTPALPPLEAPEDVEVEVEGWEAKAAASFMKDLASPIVRPRLLRSSCVRSKSITTLSVIFSFLKSARYNFEVGGGAGNAINMRVRPSPPPPFLT
jgi:hypothetical protein